MLEPADVGEHRQPRSLAPSAVPHNPAIIVSTFVIVPHALMLPEVEDAEAPSELGLVIGQDALDTVGVALRRTAERLR